jgi:serpin B
MVAKKLPSASSVREDGIGGARPRQPGGEAVMGGWGKRHVLRTRAPWIAVCLAAFGFLLVASVVGCGSAPDATISPLETVGAVSASDLKSLVAGNNAFAVDLFLQLRDGTPPSGSPSGTVVRNLLFSPYSVSCGLAMTYAGARGETADEIVGALHLSLEARVLHPAFRQLRLDLAQRPSQAVPTRGIDAGKEVLDLETAQGFFGSPEVDWNREFRDLLAECYGAELQTVDFTKTEEARALINRHVADQTDHRVEEILPPGSINPRGLPTYLVLVNALHLGACWAYPFPAATPGDFHLVDGSTVSVPTLRHTMPFPSAEGEGWRALELPYKGERLSFVVVLPDEGRFETFVQGLTAGTLEAVLAALDGDRADPKTIIFRMPKFAFRSAFRLKEPLRALGVRLAFEEDGADFSPTGVRRGGLWLDEVYHGATITVDERGTEASAATAVVGVAAITDREMIVDRPFLFLIRDRDTGTILFLGQVVDPRPGTGLSHRGS